MEEILKNAYDQALEYVDQGQPASYIPELAKEDPTKVGLAFINSEGRTYSYGDEEKKFSIQSIMKIVYFLMLLEEIDQEKILATMDMKATALEFNSIMDLELAEGKPRNPFVNAGAMASVALLYEKFGDQTEELIFDRLRKLVSDESINYSQDIYQSELDTAYNNIAIINLMVAKGILDDKTDRQKVLETYIKTCASMVNVKHLARLSFLLSNDGYDLISKEQKFTNEYGRILRTVMASSGMYNYSGEFALRVGLAAKSGVGGGIVTASKAGYGIATYCPGLDEFGNSLVGTKILELLSQELDLSIY